MAKINTHMPAINSLYHLEKNSQGMGKAMERIASGLRINNAGDDAAGAAIVNRMESQVRGLENAIRNAADAISLAQTAEGALNEVTDILQRMRELGVQAASGSYSGADRVSLNAEVIQLQQELQRIAETTYFNDTKLLNGTFQDTNFQIGYHDDHAHTITIEDIRPTALGQYTLTTTQGNATDAATPLLGTSFDNSTDRVVDAEDLTVYGHVGSATIEIADGMTSKEIAEIVTAKQDETGVYATAETRAQISFNQIADDFSDTISFSLLGMNSTAEQITAIVDFGGTDIDGAGTAKDMDLTPLRNSINAATGKTGIRATLTDDKQSVNLFSADGYTISINKFDLVSIEAGDTAPTMSLQALEEDMETTSGSAITITEAELASAAAVAAGDGASDGTDSGQIGGEVKFRSSQIFSVDSASIGDGLFNAAPGASTLNNLSDADILTILNAKDLLSIVDGALKRIDAERGDLGATMNRMQYTINNLSNVVMNGKAAQSRIQDSDIALETSNLTKTQILQQAAQAMLAQANQSAQNVLSLLK